MCACACVYVSMCGYVSCIIGVHVRVCIHLFSCVSACSYVCRWELLGTINESLISRILRMFCLFFHSIKLYTIFWYLSLYDLHVPVSGYDEEISKLEQNIKSLDDNTDMVSG